MRRELEKKKKHFEKDFLLRRFPYGNIFRPIIFPPNNKLERQVAVVALAGAPRSALPIANGLVLLLLFHLKRQPAESDKPTSTTTLFTMDVQWQIKQNVSEANDFVKV